VAAAATAGGRPAACCGRAPLCSASGTVLIQYRVTVASQKQLQQGSGHKMQVGEILEFTRLPSVSGIDPPLPPVPSGGQLGAALMQCVNTTMMLCQRVMCCSLTYMTDQPARPLSQPPLVQPGALILAHVLGLPPP
jgi:hypothetical protein